MAASYRWAPASKPPFYRSWRASWSLVSEPTTRFPQKPGPCGLRRFRQGTRGTKQGQRLERCRSCRSLHILPAAGALIQLRNQFLATPARTCPSFTRLTASALNSSVHACFAILTLLPAKQRHLTPSLGRRNSGGGSVPACTAECNGNGPMPPVPLSVSGCRVPPRLRPGCRRPD